ncbi:MAG: hypothetical protein WBD16_12345 [Pyrinomonadaceae bacterium]
MKNLLIKLGFIIAYGSVIYFFYGFVRFPDSPIQSCDDKTFCSCDIGFCNKFGQNKSASDYEAYVLWSRIAPIFLGAGIICGTLAQRERSKLKRA